MEPYLTVTVPGDPVPKGRARVRADGAGVYTPPRTVEAEQRLAGAMTAAKVTRNDYDEVGVCLRFRCATRQRRDIDNLVKTVLDAANGIAWRDDAQVVKLDVELVRGDPEPGTDLSVWVVRVLERRCRKCKRLLTRRQEAYCSKECYDTAQRKGTVRRCVGCGTDVYRQTDKANAREVFCSPACRTKRRGKCRQCGSTMQTAPSAGRAFCGAKCAEQWYRTRSVKEAAGRCACGAPTSRRAKQCRACFLAA